MEIENRGSAGPDTLKALRLIKICRLDGAVQVESTFIVAILRI